MTNIYNTLKQLVLTTTLSVSLVLGSCITEPVEVKNQELEWISQSVAVSLQGSNASQEPMPITSLDAYVFVGGTLQKIQKNLRPSQQDTFPLFAVKNCTIYFVANLASSPDLETLKEGVTNLETFLTLRSKAITTATQPELFFSGSATVTSVSSVTPESIPIRLVRSVAQFDLDTSRDDNIEVTRIIVDGIPTSSVVFSDKMPTQAVATTSCDLKYEPATKSKENVLQLYQSATPVKVTVHTLYNNLQAVVELRLDKVKRNNKYTIKLEGSGSNVTGVLQIVPWEEGGSVGGNPDQSQAIDLSNANSTLLAGDTIDEAEQKVTVSQSGGSMILALTSDVQVQVDEIIGDGGNITMTPLAVESKDGKVINKFSVNIKAQGKGKLAYIATVRMKRAAQQFAYNQFYINVKESVNQIMTATLGGVTWMAFNATTPNLDDQTYPLESETVKDVYDNRWTDAVGGLFQWGRVYKYVPWLSGSHNAGNQSPNSVWNRDTYVPCPTGYRVPTKNEMRALLPSQQVIPGTYTYNKETITAALHVSKIEIPTNVNGVGGRSRYISLTSNTGQILYIPLAGKKGDKSSTANPGFGQGLTLWTDVNQGATSGWAWTGEFWPSLSNNTGAIANDSQLQAEAFASLRCVKK